MSAKLPTEAIVNPMLVGVNVEGAAEGSQKTSGQRLVKTDVFSVSSNRSKSGPTDEDPAPVAVDEEANEVSVAVRCAEDNAHNAEDDVHADHIGDGASGKRPLGR